VGRERSQRRIAILGGGMAGLTAAFELTATPALRERHRVTLYQPGFRLGGKGASGRNQRASMRIEEHGLHVWGGYYENAFHVIRRCYGELGRRAGEPLATFGEAFQRKSFLTLAERVSGEWVPWNLEMPENDAVPGDGRVFPTAAEYVKLLAAAVKGLLHGAHRWDAASARRARILADLTLTGVRGMVADRVATRGFAALDEEDWTDWLRRHGASTRTLESPLVRAVYDTVFAYEGGDPGRPRLAAGSALHVLLRFVFTYKGAIFWEMNGGMGDVVFAPLYQVLTRRGVDVRFFHAASRLCLSADRRSVGSVRIVRQARVKGGSYEPLIDFQGLPCWPSEPLYEQLEGGAEIALDRVDFEGSGRAWAGAEEIEIHAGEDFDALVLAVPKPALPVLCEELVQASGRWRSMMDRVASVQTQALQLWLAPDSRALGWTAPRTILSGYAQPLNTWADMSHVIRWEGFARASVGSVAYFCGPLPDSPDATDAGERVRTGASDWLRDHAGLLWPEAAAGIDWSSVAGGTAGDAGLVGHYARANVSPSDRYVLSLPGSNRYRLAPGGSGFDNLVLAGDWVATSFNLGTIEAAAIAGRKAAQVLCGEPALIPGE
jgi:uncharacterized protein with NAD-binding domain and iron-sulfur cluster